MLRLDHPQSKMIDYAPLTYRVEPMRPEDIDQVMEIEYAAFSAPWSARAYDYELRYNEMAHYYVARRDGIQTDSLVGDRSIPPNLSWWQRLFTRHRPERVHRAARPPIVGYGGFWLMVDEAHISTLASHPDWRRRGIGELLLVAMIDGAMDVGANVVTLEVRVSNTVAQNLYRKYGFGVAGQRRAYYGDNGEDALIMTTPHITTAEYVDRFQRLKAALFMRLSH